MITHAGILMKLAIIDSLYINMWSVVKYNTKKLLGIKETQQNITIKKQLTLYFSWQYTAQAI